MSSSWANLTTLWRDFTWRHWLRTPKSTLALVLILALGVGVLFSIRLANRAAVAGFGLFTESLTGESDLVIESPSGLLRDADLIELRQTLGDLPVGLIPVVETVGVEQGVEERPFRLVGLDLWALPNLIYLVGGDYQPPRSLDPGAGRRGEEADRDAGGASDGVYGAFISSALATERRLELGDALSLFVNEGPVTLQVDGILPEGEFDASVPRELILLDLPTVQKLADARGRLDRVELRLPPGALAESWLAEAVQRLAGAENGRWQVQYPQARRESGAEMTQAFRLNLTVLSGLALLVGIYLILQALEASVVKRRAEIGVLRSLGVQPRIIRRAWLLEALVMGVFGSGLGLLLGFFGAQFAVGAVAQTVSAHYFQTTTEAAAWHWGEAAFAGFVGVIGSLVAGWLPARDAARTPPAQVLQRGARGGGLSLLNQPWVGFGLLLTGLGLALLPPWETADRVRVPIGGYLAALCWVVGGSIVANQLFPLLGRAVHRVGGNWAETLYASSHLRRPTGRHRLAAAGVVVAVAMATGMGILVHSFEGTVRGWIGQVLRADLYIAARGAGGLASDHRIREDVWRALREDPAVASSEVGQIHSVEVEGSQTFLAGIDLGTDAWNAMLWAEAPSVSHASFLAGGAASDTQTLGEDAEVAVPVVVNETFRHRFGKGPEDQFVIPTPTGERWVEVVAVFNDYGSERGTITVPWRAVADWFEDERASRLALYLTPGTDAEAEARRLEAQFPGLQVRSNGRLRAEAMQIFRQTFLVTHALKWIGIGVAIAGQVLALVSILIDRRRELSTLKGLGLARRGIARTVSLEGAGLSLVGITGGLFLCVALGWLLIEVINRQSFGWTLSFRLPWAEMLLVGVVVLVSSLIAARVAGTWAAKLPVDREE